MRFILKTPFSLRASISLVVLAAGAGVLLWHLLAPAGQGDVAFRYHWDWSMVLQFLFRYDTLPDGGQVLAPGVLVEGLLTTLKISFWAFLLAMAIGLVLAFWRILPSLFTRLLARTYVGIIRNIPSMVLIFIIYFFGMILIDRHVDWAAVTMELRNIPILHYLVPLESELNFFVAAVVALGLYEGAYMAEVIRAGVESVPKGQWEAAACLGLPKRTQLFSVVLPQAVRLMLPPLTNQMASLVKDSSIVSVIAVQELTFRGRSLIDSTRMFFEVWITVTLLYLLICLFISFVGIVLEKRIK